MIASRFWSRRKIASNEKQIPTRLTEVRRREGRGAGRTGPALEHPKPIRICRACGTDLKHGRSNCLKCSPSVARTNLLSAARLGRIKTHSPVAEARRRATQIKQRHALRNWNPDSKPKWLSEVVFRSCVLPLLGAVEVPRIATAISVSKPYATSIRRGELLPHPRHWENLARLVEVSEST